MRWRALAATIVLLGASSAALDASATCAGGGDIPSVREITDFRTLLTVARRTADIAAREAREIGFGLTGKELGNLGTVAIRVNAASYVTGYSCANMAVAKVDLHQQLEVVYNVAWEEGMPEADQDAIIGPVNDVVEDVFAVGRIQATRVPDEREGRGTRAR